MSSKFSVFVPSDGNRDAVVSYFANNGTMYLFNMEDYVSGSSVPAGSSDEVIVAVGEVVAEERVRYHGDGSEGIVAADEVYEFVVEGEQIGWEVVVRTASYDDMWGFDENDGE
jgi:hypothetical protein